MEGLIMNKIQRTYALTKARHDAIKADNDRREAEFCAEHGYKTEEGNPALHIWMIDDEAIFEAANEEFCALNEQNWQEEIKAREALNDAEDALIEWGLSVMPLGLKKERETLRRESERNYTIRKKLIDLAFRLDARTIKKGA
jgi:hypothetical protein